MQRFFDRYDLLLTPACRSPPSRSARKCPTPDAGGEWVDWTPFTYPFNLSQQPAISVPCGLSSAGLPIGLQIVGPKYADARVLRAARAIEAAAPFPLPDTRLLG